MALSSTHRSKAPDGVAFPVHELIYIRAWAERQRLSMHVALDRVLDGVEFEELLTIRRGHGRVLLSLWRVQGGGVVAQQDGAAPRAFEGVHAALSHCGVLLAAKARRVGWRRLFGAGRR